jgi:glutamate formiminotransferase/formiminotetrahydrofolate cyclodeaminase
VDSAQWYLQLDNLQPAQIIQNRLAELQASMDASDQETKPIDVMAVRKLATTTSALRPEGFLNAVAAGDATPGGGAVAALAGALSAALAAMVARLTMGKKRYADVESEMAEVAAQADHIRVELTDAIAEDVEAFNAVMAAYKMDKKDPKRAERIQVALLGAAHVPRQVVRLALDSMKLAHTVAEKGNSNAACDAGVAAHVGLAAVEGANLNVQVNLNEMANTVLADRTREETLALVEEARAVHRHTISVVETRAGLR